MSLDDAISSRRSVRNYAARDVPEVLAREILHLARQAPTSMDGQPCHFVVVRSRETRRRIAELKNLHCPIEKRAYRADFLVEAPLVVVVCVERSRSFGRELENGILAAAWLLLVARSRGLGSVFLTAYQPDDPALASELERLLGLPEGIAPVAIVPLGFPAPDRPLPVKQLRAIGEIVHAETFALPPDHHASVTRAL